MKKRKIIIIIAVLLVFFLLLFPFGFSIFTYESQFNQRYETYAPLARSIDEFAGLSSQRYTFLSNKGQQLVGYKYYCTGEEPIGVIVIAHGLGGGGHNYYLGVLSYFASKGYYVFAYDASGNDESEGDSVNGLPQGVIDLDYALRFVKQTEDFAGMPIMLLGHSWGAYSAGSVLNLHPDVKAIAMFAGFNKSMDIIVEEGRKMTGVAMTVIAPYMSLYERIKFGKYAEYSCESGFATSAAGVMIIHSTDDKMISSEMSYSVFETHHKDNLRFHFVKYKNRGHDYLFYTDESLQYRDEFNVNFEKYSASLNHELTAEIKAQYIVENLDKTLLYDLDQQLMSDILDFFNKYL